ncbi:hypothetical protein [Enterococcus raffinosus]|uniref:ABM domain-containing protein n=1 Tax=Enterococcus raffinosus TaxID=71452 RepID=A0AAW8TB90_9ENTE|nr:hypothetical protein [Enterococcus raffinosus]MDT2524202.1 hypothetical protein [Enterococcus raffinosus]MDT2531654.1 hypothetical protein [Enterococcus raffinosus]MDT2535060.1 hypothetical protein [Enterococcus raffinosus]MDT2545081.1 hypothetical protein [Enterococcus raffinosus]MDT2554819.1 hypothetical protein [Enterococcus raffinosus]
MAVKAYLEITLHIKEENRGAAASVFTQYREPFLNQIKGAETKDLLVRDEDVQVLHGFDSLEAAQAYLETDLFTNDVVTGLQPLWFQYPVIAIYSVA